MNLLGLYLEICPISREERKLYKHSCTITKRRNLADLVEISQKLRDFHDNDADEIAFFILLGTEPRAGALLSQKSEKKRTFEENVPDIF